MAASLSRKALILAVGTGLQALLTQVAVNLFLVRLFDSPSTFGVYRQIWLVINTAIPIFTLGIDLSLYFYQATLAASERKSFMFRSMAILGGSGMLLAGMLFMFATPIARAVSTPDSADLFRAISPYVLFTIPATLLFNFLIAQDRPARATVTNIVALLIQACLTVGMVAMRLPLHTVFLALGVSAGLRVLYSVYEIVRLSPGPVLRRISVSAGEQLRWALPVGITAQIGMIGSRLDKFVVAGSMDPAIYGLYSVGALEFPLIGLAWVAVATMMRVRIAALHHGGRRGEILEFYLSVFRKLCLALLPMAGLLAVFAPELIELLYTRDYVAAVPVFRIYLLLTLFRLMPFEAVLSSMGQTRIVLWGGGMFLVLDAALCLASVGPLGLVGPPWATVVSTLLVALYYGRQVARTLETKLTSLFPVRTFVRVLGPSALAGGAAYPLKMLEWPAGSTLVVGAVIYGAVYLGTCLGTGIVTRSDLSVIREGLPLPGRRRATN